MAKVFISYSGKDISTVAQLQLKLEEAGHVVWRGAESIKAGEGILEKVIYEISKCDYFIILLSKNSAKSRWVQFELDNYLVSLLSTSKNKFLPLVIDDVDISQSFPSIKTFRVINLSSNFDYGFNKVLRKLDENGKDIKQVNEDQKLLDFAIDLAQRAGNVVMKYYNSSFRANQILDSRKNAATKADKQTQLEIISAIKSHPDFRGDSIIAEEGGFEKNAISKQGITWVIDPLDGTQNFANSIPLFCTAIGTLKDGKPYLGVVYDLLVNEIYYAVGNMPTKVWNINRGTDVTISPNSEINELNNCLLGTHISATPKKADPLFQDMTLLKIQRSVKSIRTFGCGQLALAYVANGRMQLFFQYGAKLWDQVAGIVLIKNSGGVVKNLKGKNWQTFNRDFFVASNIDISDQFLKMLLPQNCKAKKLKK